MLIKIWRQIKRLAHWLKALYLRQNKSQRELWSKLFHGLAMGAAVGVGMKYLSDDNAANNINVYYWSICAIMFHIMSIIALMGGDE